MCKSPLVERGIRLLKRECNSVVVKESKFCCGVCCNPATSSAEVIIHNEYEMVKICKISSTA